MLVDTIVYLIEQDFLVGNNYDETIDLRGVIHDAVLILCFWHRKYVCDTPVIKPDGPKTGEGRPYYDDPSSCIAVDTD